MNTATLTHADLATLRPLVEARNAELSRLNFEERRALVEGLATLETEAADTLPPLQKAEGQARADFDEAAKALAAAHRTLEAATLARAIAQSELERREQVIHRRLRETAPESIRQTERALIDAEIDGRHNYRAREVTVAHLVNGVPVKRLDSNGPEIEALVKRIRQAQSELDRLRLEAIPPDDLAVRLEQIKARALGHLPA